MFQKYYTFLLFCMIDTMPMDLPLAPSQQTNEILQEGLARMKLASLGCQNTNKQRVRQGLRREMVELAIKKSNYKDHESGDHLEAILQISLRLPSELQRSIFAYVFEAEISPIFLEQSIANILLSYADEREFGIYSRRPFIINYGMLLKVNEPWYETIQINCDEISPLPADEKILLIKIIEGNTRAWSAKADKNIIPLSEDNTISEEHKKKYDMLYKIKETDLPVIRKILQHSFSYTFKHLEEYSPQTRIEADLAAKLKVDIEYDGPTIRDRIFTAVPVVVNCFIPDIMLCGINYGTDLFIPIGWINTGVKAVAGLGGIIGNTISGVFIENRLFPAFDQYNSGLSQLKKFFKNDRIRSKIERGDLFPFVNMAAFLCVAMGNYCLSCSSLCLKAIGCVSHIVRLFLNYLIYRDLQYENPISRRALSVQRFQTSMPYVLRDMKTD